MTQFKIIFYIEGVPVEDGEVILHAEDLAQADQVFLLKLHTKQGIPSIWDSYSQLIQLDAN